jgi:hypothetical protein
MKPIQKSHSAVIPSTVLHLDDIETIVSLLKEVSGNVLISDRDYQYDSLENLIEKVGESPKALTISGRDPYVSIRFDRYEFPLVSWLYAEAYHKEAESTFLKLREILKTKQHWANYLIRLDVALVLFAALSIIALLPNSVTMQWFLEVNTRITVASIVIFYLIVAVLLRTGTLYSIRLVKLHKKQTFWKQNSGAIVLLVIGAIVAELIRWLATLLTR